MSCASIAAVSANTAWALLIVAGAMEIGWAVGLKYTEGFTRLWPSAAVVVAMTVSVVLLGLAVMAGRRASTATTATSPPGAAVP